MAVCLRTGNVRTSHGKRTYLVRQRTYLVRAAYVPRTSQRTAYRTYRVRTAYLSRSVVGGAMGVACRCSRNGYIPVSGILFSLMVLNRRFVDLVVVGLLRAFGVWVTADRRAYNGHANQEAHALPAMYK